jgi:hypothetical protein
MRRILYLAPALMLLAGCVVHHVVPTETSYVPPPAPMPVVSEPAPTADVWYYDPHFMPEDYGGGWCYAEGPHRHDFYPDAVDHYVYSSGHYYYSGPLVFLYVAGHPVPGGGWCHHSGRHQHDYVPPSNRDFKWNRGHGWRYTGEYRATRPPPPSYWARPVPLPRNQNRPDWRPGPAPAPAPRPVVNRPTPARPPTYPAPTPGPAPWPRDDDGRDRPGHSSDAPGHGGTLPPGHGGTPPGQVDRNPGAPQRPHVPTPFPNGRDDERERNPDRAEPIPAGHSPHAMPPGQEKKYDERRPAAPVVAPPAPQSPSRPATANPFASPRREEDRRPATPAAPAARDTGKDKEDRKADKKDDAEENDDSAKKTVRKRGLQRRE